MRVALLNLRFSPNLGDVLLCECLEYGLRQASPGIDILALDITGRRDFVPGSTRRLALLAFLQRLPQPVRHVIARTVLGRSLRRMMPYWQHEFANVDGAILGGGNLLADADLNFPLKVAAILGAVADAGLPAAVHAIGVADNWSGAGEALFRDALSAIRLTHAAVRDERSRAIWMRRLGPAGIAEPKVVHDPGLLAAECYPALRRPPSQAKRVGVCVIHPVALHYHADEDMPRDTEFTGWLIELVRGFAKDGYQAFLFTTGSPEDEAYLDKIIPAVSGRAAAATQRMPRFRQAADLAGFIATLDLLVAHRLHACVAAYSHGIPHIGFTWDAKMGGFFGSVGRTRFLCTAVSTSPAEVLSLGEEAIRIGISETDRKTILAETRNDIALLAASLAGVPARPPGGSGA